METVIAALAQVLASAMWTEYLINVVETYPDHVEI